MTPISYFERCLRHSRLAKAKKLVERNTNSVGSIKRMIKFRAETGFMPQDYIDQFEKKSRRGKHV
ncbi:hypothetical protein EFS28_09775 [Lactobacillus acidophilus]|nr:hypothetical protein [Lactobacillus acidophilus]MCT3624479.1 hypothetical protein [Lactobacillus acidophilus]